MFKKHDLLWLYGQIAQNANADEYLVSITAAQTEGPRFEYNQVVGRDKLYRINWDEPQSISEIRWLRGNPARPRIVLRVRLDAWKHGIRIEDRIKKEHYLVGIKDQVAAEDHYATVVACDDAESVQEIVQEFIGDALLS